MSNSSRGGETVNGSPFEPRASSLQNNESIATPEEEPYLQESHLERPSLDIYEPVAVNDHIHLEEPGKPFAWILADKEDFIDVEGFR